VPQPAGWAPYGLARASDCAGLCAVAVPGLYRFVRFVRDVQKVQKALISWDFRASARARNARGPLHLLYRRLKRCGFRPAFLSAH
jgi:hypothetical protein